MMMTLRCCCSREVVPFVEWSSRIDVGRWWSSNRRAVLRRSRAAVVTTLLRRAPACSHIRQRMVDCECADICGSVDETASSCAFESQRSSLDLKNKQTNNVFDYGGEMKTETFSVYTNQYSTTNCCRTSTSISANKTAVAYFNETDSTNKKTVLLISRNDFIYNWIIVKKYRISQYRN